MKPTILLFSIILTFSQQFSFAQGQPLYGTTLVGVQVDFYDTTGTLLSRDTSEVHCIWSTDADYTKLTYTEYLADGSAFRRIQFAILNRYENSETRNLVVQHQQDIFLMIFWKDGSMIAYEFQNEVALFTGEIEY